MVSNRNCLSPVFTYSAPSPHLNIQVMTNTWQMLYISWSTIYTHTHRLSLIFTYNTLAHMHPTNIQMMTKKIWQILHMAYHGLQYTLSLAHPYTQDTQAHIPLPITCRRIFLLRRSSIVCRRPELSSVALSRSRSVLKTCSEFAEWSDANKLKG